MLKKLTMKNEKRYERMINEIKSDKVKTKSFTNVNSLMEELRK